MRENNKIKQPIFFMNKGKDYHVNPIYLIDEKINDEQKFVITRKTDNGKWVRGGTLWYAINGVQIFTDINNAIFVDLRSQIAFVEEVEAVVEEIESTDPEQKQYVLILSDSKFGDESFIWRAMVGRLETYEWIKRNVDMLEFDPKDSFVLTDNVAWKDALSVYEFVKHLQNANLVPEDDDFDIDEYSPSSK